MPIYRHLTITKLLFNTNYNLICFCIYFIFSSIANDTFMYKKNDTFLPYKKWYSTSHMILKMISFFYTQHLKNILCSKTWWMDYFAHKENFIKKTVVHNINQSRPVHHWCATEKMWCTILYSRSSCTIKQYRHCIFTVCNFCTAINIACTIFFTSCININCTIAKSLFISCNN